MDGDQFIPPPPPPAEPVRRRTGLRKIAATALLSVGLLAGTGVGSFVIAHAASNQHGVEQRRDTHGEHGDAVDHHAGDQDAIDDDHVSEHGRLEQHDGLGVPSPLQGGPPGSAGRPHHHSKGLPSQSSSTG